MTFTSALMRLAMHIRTVRDLPATLSRINDRFLSLALTKVDLDDHNVVVSIINERLSDRPTNADILLLKSDLGARVEALEAYRVKATRADKRRSNAEYFERDRGVVQVSPTETLPIFDASENASFVAKGDDQ